MDFIILLFLFYFMVACNGTNGTSDLSSIYDKFESLTKESVAKIYHEDDWIIVSLTENGDRVNWFLAPEVDKAVPALIKKTVYAADINKQETVTLSGCEAPNRYVMIS